MFAVRNFSKSFLLVFAAAILFSSASVSAVEKPPQGADILLGTYHRYMAKLGTNNSFGFPLVVESFEREDRVHVDVYGIFDHSFSSIANTLKDPASWCDIVSLHPNIKACTYKELAGTWLLNFYLGRKTYQPPEDTVPLISHFRNVKHAETMDIILNADEGPYGTRDHRMRFEALPLDGGKTFVHVSYAYSDSVALRLVAKIYFATLGRSKVGFTVTGTDENGNPTYIGGPRGAVERTAVRCYFAIQAFMNTLRYSEENRFSMRINAWYDLSARFKKQLFDLDKKDYLSVKIRENHNQVMLQRSIGTGLR
jgi:hypothetical protein